MGITCGSCEEEVVTPEEKIKEATELLTEAGQKKVAALLEGEAGTPEQKLALAEQTIQLNKQYPGGIKMYTDRAKTLLEASKVGANPFEGYKAQVPKGQRLVAGSEEFLAMEEKGLAEIKDTCFVLVAGGLGERLGYDDIKVALPMDTATGECYLQRYCQHIQALQLHARKTSGDKKVVLPFFIMTSGDTHEKTVALLKESNYFGMKSQITVIPQDKVAALNDNDGAFAMDADKPYEIETKPHGHGDVHMVLNQSGVAAKWAKAGKKWVCFLQDTNGLVFHAFPAALGVSAANDFDVNSITVPRAPGEAVGGICELVHEDPAKGMTLNVEYNQLEPLLIAGGMEGDVAEDDGFSAYPGNINVLIFKLQPYNKMLDATNGIVAEFVNPKYSDPEKTKFKKPTRLECMMQDYPKLLEGTDSKVGFTQMDRWASFSAVKNAVKDAASKSYPESACTGESDGYAFYRRAIGLKGAEGEVTEYAGIKVATGAHVVIVGPAMASMIALKAAFPNPDSVKISPGSSLIIKGDVVVEALELDGALEITAKEGETLTVNLVGDKAIKNKGWAFAPLVDEAEAEQMYQMRGYTMGKTETASYP